MVKEQQRMLRLRTDLVDGRCYGRVVYYDIMRTNAIVSPSDFADDDRILIWNADHNCYLYYDRCMFEEV